jgi:predicted acyltransferase
MFFWRVRATVASWRLFAQAVFLEAFAEGGPADIELGGTDQTFNMLAGGTSFLLLALFYLIIDVWGWKKWAFFFTVIGMNSIFIYLFNSMVNVRYTSTYFLGWLVKLVGENAGQVVITTGMIALTWSLLYLMYKKKIFIRV